MGSWGGGTDECKRTGRGSVSRRVIPSGALRLLAELCAKDAPLGKTRQTFYGEGTVD